MISFLARLLVCLVPFVLTVNAIVLDVNDAQSIRNAAALTAHGAQELYQGNQTGGNPGKWPFPPYYWWESGGAWGSMLQYQINTGDLSYNSVIYEAIVSQLGPAYDFILEAEVKDTGNDDQAFWVFNAMTMAEYGFPSPPDPSPSWLRVVQNAHTEFIQRWNTTYCNGGLKWQFNPDNLGFNYKQTISNSAFFQISARLGRYTGDPEYLAWAEKIWDWSRGIGLIDENYNVYDGSDELNKCSGIDHHQWTYNVGVLLYGAAALSNVTSTTSPTWVQRTVGLLDAATAFITPFLNSTYTIFEPQCEITGTCNIDEQSMKAYLARGFAQTAILAPYTSDRIKQYLQASALGAAASCTGGNFGNTCGTKWYIDGFDGQTGLGQQIAATEVMAALMVVVDDVDAKKYPGTSPNVTIAQYPTDSSGGPGFTSIAPAPMGLARPLHDQPAAAVADV